MGKKYKVFKWVFLFFFVIFLTLYFSGISGYYEYQNYQKMVLTQEQIEKFEQDVKNGKEVDVKNYMVKSVTNYHNSFSNLGLKLSTGISSIIEKSVIKVFGAISGFVTT